MNALIENRSSATDEALPVLVGYFIGEHPGAELRCEVIRRRQRVLPFLEPARCRPRVGSEPATDQLLNDDRSLYTSLIDSIKKGKGCDPDED